MTQLALGDKTAIVSLKRVLRGYETTEPDFASAAHDRLLRRIMTAHLLATQEADPFYSQAMPSRREGNTQWLAAIEQENLSPVEDAEYLGWLAYSDGKYSEAARWLKLSGRETPAALWLRAKLERRAGKLSDAVANMAKAWQAVRNSANYTGWRPPQIAPAPGESDFVDLDRWTFSESAAGDLGGLRLARAEFVDSLDTLLRGGLWDDAAYVGERVLTTKELGSYG